MTRVHGGTVGERVAAAVPPVDMAAEPPPGRHGPLLRGVAAYPVLWAIGLGAAFWPVMAVLAAPAVFRARMDRTALAAVAVVAALVVSCGVGAAAGFASVGRIVGFAANLSVWVGLIGLLAVQRSVDAAGRRRFVVGCVVVGSVNSAVGLVALALYPAVLPVPLLGGLAGSLPSGIGNFTSRDLVDASWLGGPVLRTVGMMAQPTWSGAVAVLTILLTLWLLPSLSTGARILAAAATVGNLAGVYLSYGRATQAGLVAALLCIGLRMLWLRLRIGPALVCAAVGAVLVAAVLNAAQLFAEVLAVNDAREGSADARGDIYAATLSLIGDLRVPLVGYGLKPAEDGLVASVATHSAYLGLLFRGGVIGLSAFVAFLTFCAVRCARSSSAVPVAAVLFVAIWCVVEDFDAGHLVPLFLVAAVYAAGPVAERRHEAGVSAVSQGGGSSSPTSATGRP